MRLVSTLALLCTAVPARAQPVTNPRACAVTFARAPDDVRVVVDRWVSAEVHCSVALEVRIVPTDGGLYLLATDEHGGVRERLVPNAESAGVLVASWVADDNQARGVPPPPAPIQVTPKESFVPPGVSTIVLPAMPVPVRPSRTKWFGIGAMAPLTETSGGGVRGELDVWMRGSLTAGAAASLSGARMYLQGSGLLSGDLQTRDARGIAYVAHTSQLGRWHLRPALGVGLDYVQGLVTLHDAGAETTQFYQVSGISPVLEVSMLFAREFGGRWAIYATPLATLVSQTFDLEMSGGSDVTSAVRSDLDFVVFAGVRHRL